MGFLKKDSDFSSGEHISVVSAECYFQGTLNVQGSLRVDGTLEGTVDNARSVNVGKDGAIKGDVSAQTVTCGGIIEGNVCAELLEVLASAFIKGDIRAQKMVVEEGGRIDGRCLIGDTALPAREIAKRAGKKNVKEQTVKLTVKDPSKIAAKLATKEIAKGVKTSAKEIIKEAKEEDKKSVKLSVVPEKNATQGEKV